MKKRQRRWSGWLMVLGILFGCDTAFQVGTAVQSGRQALLRKDPAQAVPHFEEAARKDPDYVYRSAHFSEGIWASVGRLPVRHRQFLPSPTIPQTGIDQRQRRSSGPAVSWPD